MERQNLSPAQIAFIKKTDHTVEFSLEGIEVLAIYSLGQMHNKIVTMTDNFFGNTKTGLFFIDFINENNNLDFSKPDEWKNVTINKISITLISPTEWGHSTDTYPSLLNIKNIALLKNQPS